MPKKHIAASASADAAPPLPARLSEILSALPVFAWVENSEGEILAHNRDPAKRREHPAPAEGSRMLPLPCTTYSLPPIKGYPQRLCLVMLMRDARENDIHDRVISALLALLLDVSRPESRQLTPLQLAILDELSRGHDYKEASYNLGIAHSTLRVHVTRMRTHLGEEIIPRRRRRGVTRDYVS